MSSEAGGTQDVAAVVNATLGLIGAALSGFFYWAIRRVLSGPGDDNPVTFLFLGAAVLALWPAWGLVRFLLRRKLSGVGGLWLAGSLAVVMLLAPFATQFMGR
ncbi:MAG TPA: hypothetical protein VE057_25780 [Archangium sp.]|nr:hypothetical protein [Archangium sp.]